MMPAGLELDVRHGRQVIELEEATTLDALLQRLTPLSVEHGLVELCEVGGS